MLLSTYFLKINAMKKPPINQTESDLFREATKDVRPLKPKNSVLPNTNKPRIRIRSQDQDYEKKITFNDESTAHFGPETPLFFARTGLQKALIKHLRHGKVPIR